MDESSFEDPEAVEAVLGALGGKYAARILAATGDPRSAQSLSETLEVPIATCYRRIDDLEAAGLLVCEGEETSDRGRRTKVYRRTIDGASLDLEDGAALRVDDAGDGSHADRNGSLRDH
jgi:predicted ArsR family transcriptional regulator